MIHIEALHDGIEILTNTKFNLSMVKQCGDFGPVFNCPIDAYDWWCDTDGGKNRCNEPFKPRIEAGTPNHIAFIALTIRELKEVVA